MSPNSRPPEIDWKSRCQAAEKERDEWKRRASFSIVKND